MDKSLEYLQETVGTTWEQGYLVERQRGRDLSWVESAVFSLSYCPIEYSDQCLQPQAVFTTDLFLGSEMSLAQYKWVTLL